MKRQWLPANRARIEAETWGMIARWIAAGRPLDEAVQYPMAPWAQSIGGILMVNGFPDFLANYEPNKTSADPVREALGLLAWHAGGSYKWRPSLPTYCDAVQP